MSTTQRRACSSSDRHRDAGVGGHADRGRVRRGRMPPRAPAARSAAATAQDVDVGTGRGHRPDAARRPAPRRGRGPGPGGPPDATSACATAVPAPPAPRSATSSRAASGSPVVERPAEAGDVGVVADRRAVLADQHGVEGADRRHVAADLVDQRHHRLLDRMGDVEPVEAELDRRVEQLAEVVLREPFVGEVDGLVDVAKALPLRLPLVQLRGQRRLDALPEQADQDRARGRRAVTGPASRAGTGSRPARR